MMLNLEIKLEESKKIIFIDRTLKNWEESNYQCQICGQYLFHDGAYSHKCKLMFG